jgi:hypothetical protein
MLREIETDDSGNVYVTSGQLYNESDILWKYDSLSGDMQERLVLSGVPNMQAPIGLHVSSSTNTVYLASGQGDPESASVTVKGFSTADLTLARTINIDGMGHVTDITEDPVSGNLWIVGFTMTDIPEDLYSNVAPFYEPYLAQVPCCEDANVVAFSIADTSSDPNNNLAMPLSIVWTVPETEPKPCEGANIDNIGSVDFADFAILASQWQQTGTLTADIALPINNRVDILDLAIIAKHWLEAGCD